MKNYLFISISILTILFSSCSNGQTQNYKSNLSATEFSKKITDVPTATIIDVRSPEEFEGGHIQNAQNMNWNGNDFDKQISNLDKSKPVLVYCLSGGRSSSAARKMRNQGFKEVYELDGGFMAWNNEGLPLANAVEKSSGLTQEEYTKMVTSDGYVLVDFSAEWCGPCKKLAPIVAEIEQEYKGKVTIVRIDVDENPELSQALNVNSIPLLHLYKKGNLVWENVGLTEKSVITEQLK
jgi:thioredoxin